MTKIEREIDGEFSKAAKNLAEFLRDPALREFLWHDMQASRDIEKIIDFKETLTRAANLPDLHVVRPKALLEQADAVSTIEEKMKAAGFQEELIGVDLYFPVDSHREAWRGEDNLLVAASPVQESNVKGSDAYVVKTGKHIILDPKKAPEMPTLVIAGREKPLCPACLSLVPLAPPPQEAEPPQEEGEDLPRRNGVHHSWIGIPWLKLLDDHEPWIRGKPEIYVLVGQSFKTTPLTSRIDLSHVDDENKWYDLGESPSQSPTGIGGPLYFYFDENYSDATVFIFMESDGGGSIKLTSGVDFGGQRVGLEWTVGGGDDSLGSRVVNKNQLGEFGYQQLTTGDVDFLLDRDP